MRTISPRTSSCRWPSSGCAIRSSKVMRCAVVMAFALICLAERLLYFGAHVERVAEAVADEVDREHGEHQEDAGEGWPPPVAAAEGTLRVGKDIAPTGIGILHAGAQEVDGGFDDDEPGDAQRRGHDHRAQRIRQQ